ATPICRPLFMHDIACARILAFERAGNTIAARMAMMAMTTSNSIKVKAASTGRNRGTVEPCLVVCMGLQQDRSGLLVECTYVFWRRVSRLLCRLSGDESARIIAGSGGPGAVPVNRRIFWPGWRRY